MEVLHPSGVELRLTVQFNRMMSNPRFLLTTWTPRDDKTIASLDRFRPDNAYDYDVIHLYPLLERVMNYS